MRLLNYIKVTLIVAFTPLFWFRNLKTNHQLDLLLIDLMKKYDFEYIDGYYTSIGGHYFWIANYPYASLEYVTHFWNMSNRPGVITSHANIADLKWGMPSRIIVYIAYQKYKKDTKNGKY